MRCDGAIIAYTAHPKIIRSEYLRRDQKSFVKGGIYDSLLV